MRADFGKVVIERPRIGHGNQNRPTRYRLSPKEIASVEQYDEEDWGLGTRRPMSMFSDRLAPYYGKSCGWGKQFSDLLGPLRKLLHSSIGRSVNTVRSELTAVLGNKSEPQRHVLTVHFEDYFHPDKFRYGGSPLREGFYEDAQGRIQYRKRPSYRSTQQFIVGRAKYDAWRAEYEAKRHKPESCEKCAAALKEHNARERSSKLRRRTLMVSEQSFKLSDASSTLVAVTNPPISVNA